MHGESGGTPTGTAEDSGQDAHGSLDGAAVVGPGPGCYATWSGITASSQGEPITAARLERTLKFWAEKAKKQGMREAIPCCYRRWS